MSKTVFILGEELVVTAPVTVSIPTSANTRGIGAQTQSFRKVTLYVDFRVPPEDELSALEDRVRADNVALAGQIREAEARLGKASADDRAAADAELADLRQRAREVQVEDLKAYIVGFPDGSGIAGPDGQPVPYSDEAVAQLVAHRHVRKGLWGAFLTLLNGPETKRGN